MAERDTFEDIQHLFGKKLAISHQLEEVGSTAVSSRVELGSRYRELGQRLWPFPIDKLMPNRRVINFHVGADEDSDLVPVDAKIVAEFKSIKEIGQLIFVRLSIKSPEQVRYEQGLNYGLTAYEVSSGLSEEVIAHRLDTLESAVNRAETIFGIAT